MSNKEEIEKLAQSLKNSGLAPSIEDARKKAEEMLDKKNKGQEIKVGKKPEPKKEESKPIEEPTPKEEPEEEIEEPKPKEKQTELFVTKEAEENIKEEPKLTEKEKKQTNLSRLFYSGKKEE